MGGLDPDRELLGLARHPARHLENGFGGLGTELVLNDTLVVDHIAMLADWQKTKKFDYGGRHGDAAPKFHSGECTFMMQSSAGYAGVKGNTDLPFGIGMLPYHEGAVGAPRNSIIGGATLWVLQGHDAAEYEGVARFFAYLSEPEVQAAWHQATGYIPITYAAYELTKQQGFYDANPGTETAVLQMTPNEPTANVEAHLPTATRCFMDDFEACIAHLRLPVTHRRATRTTNLLERLLVDERRRLKIIPNGFGEKAVLKLMVGALIRASGRRRGLRLTECETRQLAAVRNDLDDAYAVFLRPTAAASQPAFSSSSRP